MIATRTVYLIVVGLMLAYVAFRFRRSQKSANPVDGVPGFRPGIGFSSFDGMQSISLLLENESAVNIHVEEIEISLRDLVASDQTAEPPCREVLRIRQTVCPEDVLPISLAGVIYKAAGEPQREYSCGMSAVLRFRVGENSFERNLEECRIQMVGLTASGIRRERKRTPQPIPVPRVQEAPRSIAAVAAKSK